MKGFDQTESTRNRLDFVCLRDGGVVLYHADAVLDADLHWLAAEGYLVVECDAGRWTTVDDLFHWFAREFKFPPHFGHNLDAFHECMTGDAYVPECGVVVVIRGVDVLGATLGHRVTDLVVETCSSASHELLLYGRRLIFLLQSRDPRIVVRLRSQRHVLWNDREHVESARGR